MCNPIVTHEIITLAIKFMVVLRVLGTINIIYIYYIIFFITIFICIYHWPCVRSRWLVTSAKFCIYVFKDWGEGTFYYMALKKTLKKWYLYFLSTEKESSYMQKWWGILVCSFSGSICTEKVSLDLAHWGSQSEHRICHILPAQRACHMIIEISDRRFLKFSSLYEISITHIAMITWSNLVVQFIVQIWVPYTKDFVENVGADLFLFV